MMRGSLMEFTAGAPRHNPYSSGTYHGFGETFRIIALNMTLRPGMVAVAERLQEASDMSTHSDVRSRLSDAVQELHKGMDTWGYYTDHTGDGESGDVIYSSGSKIMKAPYEMSKPAGVAPRATIYSDKAKSVVPTTMYDEEAEDTEHYTAMQESMKDLYVELPLYERFISKADRDKADSGDFAGKGKSFPILKPADVSAAAHALGRAGSGNDSTSTIKARIIAIAKKKDWEKSLPKAWQSGASSKEAAAVEGGDLKLCESAATLETIVLKEARGSYDIKLIAPGPGSSAFYPKEVLQRDGPKVFKAGTHVYLNHPTQAEEAARPEGDVKNLAGVLASDAVYHESHPKGPGLYASMKVFADHAQTVEEKAPHVGMSIRASGIAESGTRKGGLPVLKELTHAESVDVVTRAGAGGMILSESARDANLKEAEMTAEEITKLVESTVTKAVTETRAAFEKPVSELQRRALRGDALVEAQRILSDCSLVEASKARVVEACLSNIPEKDGAIDAEKLKALVEAEAKREGAYVASLTGSGRVFGMGASALVESDPVKAREARKLAEADAKEELDNDVAIFESLGMPKEAATFAAKGRAA